METKPIRVVLSNNHPFVWNGTDACLLREEYRIVGTLVGSYPRFPRQNNQLSLPLELLPEEAILLRDKGIAELVDGNTPPPPPSDEQVEHYEQFKETLFAEQVDINIKQKKDDIIRNLESIKGGKKEKRNKLLEERRKAGEEISDSEFERDVNVSVDDFEIEPLAKQSMMIQIFTEDPFPKEDKIVVWEYPRSEMETLRCRVFRDIWEKGYFLTTGGKFGGDFLVYPGDPFRYHSFYIAICVLYKKPMCALDIAAWGRLGSNVKKTVLLCSLDDNDELLYTSLEWTGIS